MLGVMVNSLTVFLGGMTGLFIKGGLKDRYRDMLMQAMGIAILFVGLTGALKGLLDENSNSILFIISLALGSLLGEWIGIETRLERFGKFVEYKMKGKGNIAQGFVTGSLLFCVGAMAILGSLQSGIEGNHNILYVKAVIDGVCAMILASALGFGVVLSAGAIFIYQGFICVFSGILKPVMTSDVMREISIVGYIIIAVMGLDISGIIKIKYGNMFPSVFIPVLYYTIYLNFFSV